MNSIIIKGRLARDPELHTTASGNSVCNFCVAVNRNYAKDGEEADFFDCVAWGKTGEVIDKYFSKGKEILVQGEIQSRKWQDKEGNKRMSWELQVQRIEFCGSGSGEKKQPTFTEDDGNEGLPF